ncbi:hypothetical protein diail_4500, partial [Diaporthe ilicicola]
MGIFGMLVAYGMTETGPVTFITSIEDSRNKIFGTVGQVLPHVAAKVVDGEGNIVPRGTRGGENISPVEIEDRLLEHPSVTECCVIGLDDALYGEVVSCFLGSSGGKRPADQEIRDWVTAVMDRSKAPGHIFWLGESDVGEELPKTGSGKYQKHLIRAKGNEL